MYCMYSKNVKSVKTCENICVNGHWISPSIASITQVSDAPSSWRTLVTACEPLVWAPLHLLHLRPEGTAWDGH